MLDIAKAAGARAHIAEHQEGGRAGAPAFAHVRAHGFFADGMQFLRTHQGLQAFVGLAGGRRVTLIHSGRRKGCTGKLSELTRARVGVDVMS